MEKRTLEKLIFGGSLKSLSGDGYGDGTGSGYGTGYGYENDWTKAGAEIAMEKI